MMKLILTMQYSQRKKLREKRRAGWVFIFIWWPFRVMIDIQYRAN
jgi:hypothetical protein